MVMPVWLPSPTALSTTPPLDTGIPLNIDSGLTVQGNLTVNGTTGLSIIGTQINAPTGQVLWFGTNGFPNVWYMAGNGAFLAGTDNQYDIGASGANRPRNIYVAQGIIAGAALTSGSGQIAFASSQSWLSGSGTPAVGMGINGDFYFRTDTPGTANQRIYVKSSGAWVGIV